MSICLIAFSCVRCAAQNVYILALLLSSDRTEVINPMHIIFKIESINGMIFSEISY